MLSIKALVLALVLTFLPLVIAEANVKRWSPPLPSCTTFPPFVYAGCFNDPSVPSALIYRATELSNTNMTVEVCVAFCKGNGYRYAGLEYYGECFCGASVNGAQIDESNCNYPCTGNSSEVCGGTDIISVYQDTTFPTVNDSTISDYKALGCYSEGTNGRALVWQQNQLSTTNITVEECLFACKDGGYPFAGVEYATQCFCGVVLGNGTVPLESSQCNMACTGNSTEMCGGSSTLDLYVAVDLESTEPCGYVSSSSSTSPTPTPTTSSSKTTSLCTATTTTSPTPTCEYKCGGWCSNPLPPFSDQDSCSIAASNCAVQVSSCFLQAGFPSSLNCFEYSSWCSNIGSYCQSYCPGNQCSLSSCKSKWPPSGSPPPPPSVSTSVYTCTATRTSTTSKPSTTSCVPIPTQSCICTQPSNPGKGYTPSSPVGSIGLPCLTCNNLFSDYSAGNWFKLYISPQSESCPSYPKGSVPQGCKAACDNQHAACRNTYAESCKSNSAYDVEFGGKDSYESACTKCDNQWNDCYGANQGVSGGNRCWGWNSGWS